MRKRGARFSRAKAAPGLIAQSVNPQYEVQLRLAADAFRGGWAQASHFNDLADTLDLMRIGLECYAKQRPDPSAEVAGQLARDALLNIRERYLETGKWGATSAEFEALLLLVDTSLDYWNRRGGVLYAYAYTQLKELRKRQYAELEQEQAA